jgi:TPR repeat protein
MKYYEAQFGLERRDEMIRHVATNANLRALLESLDLELRRAKSKKAPSKGDALSGKTVAGIPSELWENFRNNRESIETATRLFFAYGGEDYHAALPAIIARRNLDKSDVYRLGKTTIPAAEKEDIIKGSLRGGLSTGYIHARWMLEGTEVVKDETRGWGLFASCAEYSTLAAHEYANALLKMKSNDVKYELALPICRKIAIDTPGCRYAGPDLYNAMNCAKELGLHVDYLTLGYVSMAKFGENSHVSTYEREHGDARSTWWPWSKPNRILAQQGAAQIIEKAKGLENGRFKRRLWAFDDVDAANKEIALLIDKAHDGDSVSMYDLGIAYLEGINGFPKNPEAAREWFRLSSARRFVPGTYNYAICLNEAVGGPADPKEAARLFRIGAMRGDPLSQHNLGVAYGIGRGVERDYVEAIAWWHLCKSKVPQVKASLDKVDGPKYRSIAEKAKLRSEELSKEIGANIDSLKKNLIW